MVREDGCHNLKEKLMFAILYFHILSYHTFKVCKVVHKNVQKWFHSVFGHIACILSGPDVTTLLSQNKV